MDQRVGLLEHPVKLLERLRFRRALVVQRHRPAAHRRRQVFRDLQLVDRNALDRLNGALRALEYDGANHYEQRGEYQKSQGEVQQSS